MSIFYKKKITLGVVLLLLLLFYSEENLDMIYQKNQ